MVRAVVDTNIVLSGFLSAKGAPAEVLEAWIERRFVSMVSGEIKKEYLAALQYEHIKRRLGREFHSAKNTLRQILKLAENIYPKIKLTFFSDPQDNMFVEAAIAGKAAFLVTGDKAMLAMGSYDDVKILNAREFLSHLR